MRVRMMKKIIIGGGIITKVVNKIGVVLMKLIINYNNGNDEDN